MTWTPQTLPSSASDLNNFRAVSCATVSDCVVVGESTLDSVGDPILTTMNGGSTWGAASVPSGTGDFSAVSCVIDTLQCVAVGTSASGYADILISTDGGNTWANQVPPAGTVPLNGVSCATTSDCVAVGNSHSSPGIVVTDDGGSTWTSESVPSPTTDLEGVSCASSAECVAVGGSSNGNAIVIAGSDAGQFWSSSSVPTGTAALSRVSCIIACVTVGSVNGVAAALTNQTGIWAAALTFPQGMSDPSAISCPGASDCAVVGYDSIAVTSDGSTTWDFPTGVSYLNGVSCISATDCVAVGENDQSQSNGAILVTVDGGTTWTSEIVPAGVSYLAGVSCVVASEYCVSVGEFAGPSGGVEVILTSTDGGTTWTNEPVSSPVSSALHAVSCATTTFCMAVGSDPVVTTDGGTTWTSLTIHDMQNLFGVSCATTSDCVASGSSVSGWGGESTTHDGGTTWTTQALTQTNTLDGVSCTSSANCVVSGSRSTTSPALVLATGDGGTTWGTQSLPSNIGLGSLPGISCVTAISCMAVGSDTSGVAVIGSTSSSGVAPLEITSADADTAAVGDSFAFTVTTSGSPTPSLSEEGALPEDVGFVDNGNGTATLSGTPAAGSSGTYVFTIEAENGLGGTMVYQSFSLVMGEPVHTAPQITSTGSVTTSPKTFFQFYVTTNAWPVPTISESGALPGGVSFVDDGHGTATLAGTTAPGSGGAYPLTISASNGVSPNATQSFTLVVDEAPTIGSVSSATFATGLAGHFTISSALGFPTPSLSETGTLPGGVTFVDNHNGTATLAGTPSLNSANTYHITITAANGVGSAFPQAFVLTVTGFQITTASLLTGATKAAYSAPLSASGGNPPYKWSLAAGALPKGLHLRSNGVISGRPRTSGTYIFTVKVVDHRSKKTKGHPSTQNTATKVLSITIS